MRTDSFGPPLSPSPPPSPTNGSELRGLAAGRRPGWGRRLLTLVRGPWLPQAAAVLLFVVLLGLLAVFLLGRY